jgi:hypothetical protein
MSAPPYMPVEAKPWRLRMGLRPLELQRWLEVDSNRSEELAIKHRLLGSPDTHSQVVANLPGSEVAGKELLDLVLEHLSRHHPGLVTATPDGKLIEESTGLVVDPEHLHPVDAAARLVQEDLCLMTRAGTQWVLGSASVCFPSRWSLADKVGRDLTAIHAPVPGYEDELARPTHSFFERLTPDRPVWRLNWTLLTDRSLHQPDPGSRQWRHAGRLDPARDIWFRVERQTLRRLICEAVVFTIRTYVTPLPELLERHPEARTALRVALAGTGPDVLAYKGWEDLAPRLLAWLAG